MQNLLKETIECLNDNDKQTSDVLWVGRDYTDWREPLNPKPVCYKSTWDDFCLKANFMYDDGYGGNEIPMDLIVVGKDFWLERHEYDGSEWWEFKTMPVEPEETRELVLKSEGRLFKEEYF